MIVSNAETYFLDKQLIASRLSIAVSGGETAFYTPCCEIG
jgi:hypothetical protein